MKRFSAEERRRRLGHRHHLSASAVSVDEVAASLVGLHSSDPATVYLGCRARLDDFTGSQLERALYEDRTLLRMLGMRRTMFVVPRDLAAAMDAGCTKFLAAPERRRLIGFLERQGVAENGDTWLRDVEGRTSRALDRIGPATAKQLTTEVPELATKLKFGEGKTWGGQVGVSTRVLFLLATSGQIVRGKPLGTWLSSQYQWATMTGWLPEGLAQISSDAAQIELVRRWLASYGPGSLADIAWWTGWGKRVTEAALAGCRAVVVDMAGQPGYALPHDLELSEENADWAAFLPSLDSTIMGWKEREWYLGAHQHVLYDRNGNAGPSIWFNGRVVGGWSQGPEGDVRYRLLDDVGSSGQMLIAAAAGPLEEWLGDSRLVPRFRTPLEKELSA
jgi:hypothetical protein